MRKHDEQEEQEEQAISTQLAHKDLVSKLNQALNAVNDEEWENAEDLLVAARGMLEAYTYGYPNPTGLLAAITKATAAVKEKNKPDAAAAIRQAIQLAEKRSDEDQSQNATTSPDQPTQPDDLPPVDEPKTEARTTLAVEDILPAQDEFLVTIMTAGNGNGFTWPEKVLAEHAHMFNGITAFVNHERIDAYNARPGGRTVDDIAGVYYNAHFDPQTKGVRARFKPMPPRGEWTAHVINAIIAEREKGTPVPNVGISADISFTHRNRVVSSIKKVHSADIVFNPARGPQAGEAFARIANQVQENLMNNQAKTAPEGLEPNILQAFLNAQREALLNAQLANMVLRIAIQRRTPVGGETKVRRRV